MLEAPLLAAFGLSGVRHRDYGDRMTRELNMSYGEVEDLLSVQLGVQSDRRATLRSRVQYLQRGGFPALDHRGKGTRSTYPLDAVFQMSIAMELADLGWPSQSITSFVQEHWTAFRELVDAGGDVADGTTTIYETPIAILHPEALEGLREERARKRLEVVPRELVSQWLLGESTPTSANYIVLDVARIAFEALRRSTEADTTSNADRRVTKVY